MELLRKLALQLIAAALMTGCSGVRSESYAPSADDSTPVSSADETSQPEQSYSAGEGIALINIDTVSTDPNVMDFVTEPVARHVAEDIASWTPRLQGTG